MKLPVWRGPDLALRKRHLRLGGLSWSLCLACIFILSACSGLEKNEQPQLTALRSLTSGQKLGQSFVPRYNGLQAVSIYLSPGNPEARQVLLEIKDQPGGSEVLRTAALDLFDSSAPGYYRFDFQPISDSNLRYLFLEFQIDGTSGLQVGTAPAQSYMNGSLYENGIPVEAQLSFLLSYQSRYALTGLIKEFLTWVYRLFIAIMLFMIPGWAVASFLVSSWNKLSRLEKAAIGISGSLAIYPLFLLWTDVLGMYLGAFYAWLPVIAGLIIIAWRNWEKLRSFSVLRNYAKSQLSISISWAGMALFLLFFLLFATRFWAIRTLDAPLWGDSYQHSVITQLIVDHGGLFTSWQPYTELESFTYHFGFHSLSAVYHWITGLPVHHSVMWVGQILNAFAVICLYPLALRMKRNPWSGVAAVFFAALLSAMPMFYVNWGRYTQLTGLVILPALVWATWTASDESGTSRRNIAFVALLLAGLGLTHYRVLIFAVGWFLALILVNSFTGGFKKTLLYLVVTGILAGLLITPWLLRILRSDFLDWIITLFPRSINPTVISRPAENPFAYLPRLTWFVLPLLVGWGLWRRNPATALVGIWWLIQYLIVNLKMFRLPFTGLDLFTFQISNYLFFALFLGENAGWLVHRLHASSRMQWTNLRIPIPILKRALSILFVVAGLGLTLWAARMRLWDVKPDIYGLVARPDINAYEWIEENTTSDSKFLVNSFFAFNNTVIVGSDGGWWLPLLGNRMTTTPPINYDFEAGPRDKYQETTNLLVLEAQQKGLNDPGVIKMLQERGIEYIYVGQKQGSVNSPKPMIEIEQLIGSPNYQQLYHQDRVWIFKLQVN